MNATSTGQAKATKGDKGAVPGCGVSPMIGELTSITQGPERNVRLVLTPTELLSEIAEPAGCCDPHCVDHYEVFGLRQDQHGLVSLTLVLSDRRRVRFYCTLSKFDMALLLDQLDAALGEKKRVLR